MLIWKRIILYNSDTDQISRKLKNNFDMDKISLQCRILYDLGKIKCDIVFCWIKLKNQRNVMLNNIRDLGLNTVYLLMIYCMEICI